MGCCILGLMSFVGKLYKFTYVLTSTYLRLYDLLYFKRYLFTCIIWNSATIQGLGQKLLFAKSYDLLNNSVKITQKTTKKNTKSKQTKTKSNKSSYQKKCRRIEFWKIRIQNVSRRKRMVYIKGYIFERSKYIVKMMAMAQQLRECIVVLFSKMTRRT